MESSLPANYQPLTPLSFLRRASYVFGNKTAVVYGDWRYPWKEFAVRVNCLSSALKDLGIKKGDKVAFLCRNLPPLLEAHYGVPQAGAVLVTLNTRFFSRELSYILNHSESKVLFVDETLADHIEPKDIPGVKTIIGIADEGKRSEIARKYGWMEYEDFLKTGRSEYVKPDLRDENDPISINYTSGTTGLPKGCVYTHRGTYIQSLVQTIETGLNVDSVFLWTLPMFHCNGWCRTWAVACQGSTSVCMPRPDAPEIYRLVIKEGVTHMCGAPIVWARLGEYMDARGLKFPHRVKVEMGGAAPPFKVIQSMESKGAEVIHGYGLTESLDGMTICERQPEWAQLSVEERAKLKCRQGVPNVAAGEVRVVDENMQDVPADGKTVGEIVARSNALLKEYYKQPEETATAFSGGWFHTGDGAVIHPDGYLEIKDRFKDVIKSGGELISSIEVENVVCEHPDVAEAACFAVKDEEWGEIVKALVTPKPGVRPTAKEIIDFCRARIAHYKCPKLVEFGEITRSSTGKVLKDVLRKREQVQNSGEGKTK